MLRFRVSSYVYSMDSKSVWITIDVFVQGAAEKSNSLDLLAVFSAMAGNFNAKFYTLTYTYLFVIYLSHTCR